MAKFYIALYRFFKGHKVVFYSILTVTTLVFAYFAMQLHFEENIAALLPKTEESTRSAVAFSDIKVKDKVFVEIASKSGEATPGQLAAAMDDFIAQLTAKDEKGCIDNILYKFDVDDIMNLAYYAMDALPCHIPPTAYPYIDSLLNQDAIDGIISGEGRPALPAIGSYALVDMHLLSQDSAVALAYIAPSFPSLDTKQGTKMEKMLGAAARAYEEQNPDYQVLYHGSAIEGTYNSKQVKKDIVLTVSLSLLIICFIICLSFRGRRTLLHLVVPIVYGALFSMACIYWIKGTMSFIAIGIGALVLGVALSYCLHVFTHFKYVQDAERTIREQTRPVTLGCLTTIGAFAGLLFTSSELLSDFGLFASFTLVGTTFFALAFLPQFFVESDKVKDEKAFADINRINGYPLDRNKAVVIALVAIIAVTVVTSRGVGFDSDLSHIGHREAKIVASEELYAEKVNHFYHPTYFAACSADLDSAIVMNGAVRGVLDSLKRAGAIHDYSSPSAFLLSEAQQQENIDAWKEFWTPERAGRGYKLLKHYAAEYGWEEKTGMDIPETFRLMTEADFYPVSLYDYGAVPESLMSNFVEQVGDKYLVLSSVMMESRRDLVLDRLVADAAQVVVLDPFFYTGDMVEIVHSDFSVVLWISSLFVFLVLLASFRSLTVSLIAFMPMFVSWYVVQGVMAIFGIEFNLVNIMLSTFIFGIGVDYSIFVMDGLIFKAKSGGDALLASHKAAIFFSGVTLIIVTASLLLAKHPALYSVGIITLIGMVSTILITYALEPLLFRVALKSKFLRKVMLKEK